jgi:hypothetical protein
MPFVAISNLFYTFALSSPQRNNTLWQQPLKKQRKEPDKTKWETPKSYRNWGNGGGQTRKEL